MGELKNALAPRGLMLTCATAVGASTVEHGFDVAAMSKIFDQIHIMAYDFHGTCDGKPFSLIKTIIEAINGPIVIPTTPAPLTTPSTMPTVPTTAPTTVPTVPTTAPTTAPTVPTTAPTTAPTDPTTAPTTTPTVPTTNPTNPTTPRGPTTPHIICQSAGLFANPDDCHMFYQCSINLQGGWTVESYTCAQGTVFNPEIGSCDWPYKVPGCENPTF